MSEARPFLLQIEAMPVIVVSRNLLAIRSATPDADILCGLMKPPAEVHGFRTASMYDKR
jgi:hypothetical protein